jgi:hypothetical protein
VGLLGDDAKIATGSDDRVDDVGVATGHIAGLTALRLAYP